MVEIQGYSLEAKGTMLLLNYSINGNERSMRVNGIFKNYILENHKHNGINEANYLDFINKVDVKYKLEDKYLIDFIDWYHNI